MAARPGAQTECDLCCNTTAVLSAAVVTSLAAFPIIHLLHAGVDECESLAHDISAALSVFD